MTILLNLPSMIKDNYGFIILGVFLLIFFVSFIVSDSEYKYLDCNGLLEINSTKFVIVHVRWLKKDNSAYSRQKSWKKWVPLSETQVRKVEFAYRKKETPSFYLDPEKDIKSTLEEFM